MTSLSTEGDEAVGAAPVVAPSVDSGLGVLASEIEDALRSQLEMPKDYFKQARSIIFNLKDTSNGSFRLKILTGEYKPEYLPRMKAEEMASETRNAERTKLRQEALDATMLKATRDNVTDRFTCENCLGTTTSYSQRTAIVPSFASEPNIISMIFICCLNCNYRWTQKSGNSGKGCNCVLSY